MVSRCSFSLHIELIIYDVLCNVIEDCPYSIDIFICRGFRKEETTFRLLSFVFTMDCGNTLLIHKIFLSCKDCNWKLAGMLITLDVVQPIVHCHEALHAIDRVTHNDQLSFRSERGNE